MTRNVSVEDRLGEEESILLDIPAELVLRATHQKQRNGRLIATTTRLLFICEIAEQIRFDEFPYDKIEAITTKYNKKTAWRIIFDSDEEIQVIEQIESEQRAKEIVQFVRRDK